MNCLKTKLASKLTTDRRAFISMSNKPSLRLTQLVVCFSLLVTLCNLVRGQQVNATHALGTASESLYEPLAITDFWAIDRWNWEGRSGHDSQSSNLSSEFDFLASGQDFRFKPPIEQALEDARQKTPRVHLSDQSYVQTAGGFDPNSSSVVTAAVVGEVSDASYGTTRVSRTGTASVYLTARQIDETGKNEAIADAKAADAKLAAPTATVKPNGSTEINGSAATGTGDAAQSIVAVDAPLSLELLQSRQQQLLTSTDLDPALKESLGKRYESIIAELTNRNENEKAAKGLSAAAEAAPAAIAEMKRRKENLPKFETIPSYMLRNSTQEALQSMLQQQQTASQTIVDARTAVETKIANREARKKEVYRLISEQKALQVKLNEEMATKSPDESDGRLAEAKSLLLRAKIAASVERVRMIEQEIRTYEAESELLPLQRDLLLLEEKHQQAQIKLINEEISSRRETKIDSYRKFAEKVLENKPTPEQEAIAQNIVKRSAGWLTVARDNRDVQLRSEESAKRREMWEQRYKNMTDRIKSDTAQNSNGLNSWVGLLLRRQRSELPSPRKLSQELNEYQSKMQQIDSLNLELDDWKARHATNQYPEGSELHKLHGLEMELITDFRHDAGAYFENLDGICERKQMMFNLIKRYREFIDQHVLWIRSADPIKKLHFQQIWPSLTWLFDFSSWKSMAYSLIGELRLHVTEAALFTIGWIVLIFNTRKMRRKIKQLGDLAARGNNTRYLPTVQVLLLTLLVAVPWPALMAYLGLRLYAAGGSQQFVQQFGLGLAFGARFFFAIEVLRQVCRSGGLAEKHLGWPNASINQVRRHLRWFLDVSLPLVVIVAMVFDGGDEVWENSLGRFAFCLLMFLCTAALAGILHPRKGALSEYITRHEGGWLDRLRYVWYIGLVSAPVLLAIGSALGYHYTSVRIAMLFHQTAMTLIGIFIVYALATRWLLLSRRRLAIAQARQRLEDAQRESSIAIAGNSIPNDVRSTEFRNEMRNEQSAVDLAAINAQTMSLVSAAAVVAAMLSLSFIWSDVLPAVNALQTVHLWEIQVAPADFSAEGVRIPAVMKWITLSDILFAIPIAVLTIFAVRNLPGLLEIVLLQHLPIENAARYAITTVSRYALLTIGIAMTFNYIGVRWSSVQWLVAALGVGLGFGLQEIFGNFISGLILLFEQPIRVGDVVSIGDTTGAVAKIRMRATTITNWDRQELIVPNKDLITGRLLNWTLSDSTNRMILTVGVAYGSDTEAACEILRDVCAKHKNVLQDPPPTAFFEKFADSSLELTLRFFLQTLDLRLLTRHELLTDIHRRFAEAKIEIAFPQRDLHLRSIPGQLSSFINSAVSPSAPPESDTQNHNGRRAG